MGEKKYEKFSSAGLNAQRLAAQKKHAKEHGEYVQTPEDKALIDEAIAEGRITYCPSSTYTIDQT